ncbi:MAG: molybdopterin-guanine dinucleotide biosynthesis protein B [Kurthia sp.]|nr:molybdopterin-guanine dinucleotide biosynthesis protein B [Candidatus Kurthia equi]
MALGQYQKILQVVGYQNSGKTTLMEQLITWMKNDGYSVATIKHHGHGGTPTIDESKDSARHEKAGADLSAVEGDGMLRLNIRKDSWSLPEILSIYEKLAIDIVLVEGYKKEKFPKIVLVRTEEDFSLVEKLDNILCVLYWPDFTGKKTSRYPAFSMNDSIGFLAFIGEEMRKKHATE